MPSLSACIVVKDGRKSIRACLDSLVGVADEIVVVDTGSTDGTPEIVGGFSSSKGAPRVVMELAGDRFVMPNGSFDFGAAKQYALTRASCDYVMWVDCNEVIEDPKCFRETFCRILAKFPNASVYANTRTSPNYWFPRLRAAPRKFARFEGRIHELMRNDAPDAVPCDSGQFIRNFKKTRDVDRNIKCLLGDWELGRKARTAFYLGNSYKDKGMLDKAVEWYAIAVDEFPDSLDEERLKSLETLCSAAFAAHDTLSLGRRSLQAIQEFPGCPEGYYWRGRYNYVIGNYTMCAKCISECLKLAKPHGVMTWINPEVYDSRLLTRMLDDARNRAQFANALPLRPDHIEDSGYGSPYGGSRVQFEGYGY